VSKRRKVTQAVLLFLFGVLPSGFAQTRKPAPKLSQPYAKAALLALKTIEKDETIPKQATDKATEAQIQALILMQQIKKLMYGEEAIPPTSTDSHVTQSTIDAADVEATTAQEKAITDALNSLLAQKQYNNSKRAFGLLAHESDDEIPKAVKRVPETLKAQALVRANDDPVIQAINQRESVCSAALETTLRSRLTEIPKACSKVADKSLTTEAKNEDTRK